MASKRPHFSATGPQLQKLFEANRYDGKVLRELLAELKHRSTPTAQALRKEVEEALDLFSSGTAGGGGSSTPPVSPPAAPRPFKPPSSQTVSCRNCATGLRVPIRSERTAYTCPSCKAEFETVFKDGVLQVIWVDARTASDQKGDAMTELLAREVLGVAAGADFPTIKAAWRKASQQYHPDKHQSLPERLRRAAEIEMKRINEAYRFLEAYTASDF